MNDSTQLDDLVVRYEELRAQGNTVSAEELCAHCPELLGELKRQIRVLESMNALLGGPQGNATSEATPGPALPGPSSLPPVSPTSLCTGSRYRLLRLHARGGLGEVHVAQDEELHREVALKRLQPLKARHPQSRQRFLREAEITSRLEHPSIVPIHAVGQDADGRPFYAMRFVRGDTLLEAIQRWHAPDSPGRSPGARRLDLRQLVGRLVAVCNTVAYAHSRGIVHRDIKPGNILLGDYGETLVVDWGLAKPLAAAGPSLADETDTDPAAPGTTEDATEPGAVLGTPAYMSPEQAAGQRDLVGPANDVYSLGATLYAVLTGQAPFQGSALAGVVDRVKRGDFLPPRQRQPAIPRPLEAICLKALARRLEDRYATALEMAADLEHWLADEPVSVWREPWTVRLRRWSGRHRTLVTAAAAALLVGLVSLTAATLLLQAANARERAAGELARRNAREARHQRAEAVQKRNEARERQRQATENFRLARQTVEQYCTRVSKDPRLRQYDLEGLRKELLQSAVKFCNQFVRQRSDDPEVLAEQGTAYQLLGLLTQTTASPAEAIAMHRRAVDIFLPLTRKHPAVAEYQQKLAASHNDLGMLQLMSLHHYDEAAKELGTALNLRKALVREHSAVAAYLNDLGRSHHNLGILGLQTRQWESARIELDRSLDVRKKLVARYPTVAEYQAALADTHNNRGVLYHNLRQPKQLIEELRRSLALWEKLTRDHPTEDDFQGKLAMNSYNLGVLYSAIRRPKQAEAAYLKALTIRQALARAHPTILDYQHKLARTHHALGAFYAAGNRPREAETAYLKGVEIHERLMQAHPAVLDFAVDLGKGFGRLGHLVQGRAPEAALGWFDRSCRTHEAVLAKQPHHSDSLEALRHSLAGRALVRDRLHRYAEALEDWDRSLALGKGPAPDRWQARRAVTLAHLGEHGLARDTAAALAGKTPISADVLYDVACVYALAAAARPNDRAEADATRAVELLTRAHVAGYFRTAARRAELKTDSDLASLRSRDDFKKFLARVGNGTRMK
jgi:serine/threonine-protein kinase